MSVLVVEPPARLVSLEDMKAHLRVTADDEDALIEAYIDAACGWLDGPDGWLGRCIGSQVIEVFYGSGAGAFPYLREPHLTVPIGPVQEVLEVEYWGHDGVGVALDLAGVETRRDLIDWGAAATWPSRTNRVRLRYRAGFAETPAPVAQAIKLLVGQWFRNRSGINIGNIVNQLPNGVKALLGPYHRRRV
jgi:uncharacterized phiE125 gp8 family phage protein